MLLKTLDDFVKENRSLQGELERDVPVDDNKLLSLELAD
jgi:hypothetical protein